MLHNGVSSKAPYFEEAKRTDMALYGSAFVWSPQGSSEAWLIPPEWVTVVRNQKTKEVVHYIINQTGCINNQLIDFPADEIRIHGRTN